MPWCHTKNIIFIDVHCFISIHFPSFISGSNRANVLHFDYATERHYMVSPISGNQLKSGKCCLPKTFQGKSGSSTNRVPKCDVTKILFLENCNFGLKF